MGHSQKWYLIHPSNSKFGSSPDAIGPAGPIIEIKKRASSLVDLLQSLEKFLIYFAQTQLQMKSTDASFCILLFYHPETKSGGFLFDSKGQCIGRCYNECIYFFFSKTKILYSYSNK